MILYNVTTKVDWSIQEKWLQWMKNIHIPGMMATGFFTEHRMVKLLHVDESDGATYAVQYLTRSLEDYEDFVETQLSLQSEKEAVKWGDKYISFSTIMEVVQ